MNFTQAIASGFRHYATSSGRAPRSEYWYWILFTLIGGIATAIIDQAAFTDSTVGPLNAVFNLICLLPSFAVAFRRLHDIDRTAWWWLIGITIVGIIVLIVWACQKGTAGPNRFGPDPLGGA